jgi:hypothetical protein
MATVKASLSVWLGELRLRLRPSRGRVQGVFPMQELRDALEELREAERVLLNGGHLPERAFRRYVLAKARLDDLSERAVQLLAERDERRRV